MSGRFVSGIVDEFSFFIFSVVGLLLFFRMLVPRKFCFVRVVVFPVVLSMLFMGCGEASDRGPDIAGDGSLADGDTVQDGSVLGNGDGSLADVGPDGATDSALSTNDCDPECAGLRDVCDRSVKPAICVECLDQGDCAGTAEPICDVPNRSCVECNNAGDCYGLFGPLSGYEYYVCAAHACEECDASSSYPSGHPCD